MTWEEYNGSRYLPKGKNFAEEVCDCGHHRNIHYSENGKNKFLVWCDLAGTKLEVGTSNCAREGCECKNFSSFVEDIKSIRNRLKSQVRL